MTSINSNLTSFFEKRKKVFEAFTAFGRRRIQDPVLVKNPKNPEAFGVIGVIRDTLFLIPSLD